jgi:hypothetical protein
VLFEANGGALPDGFRKSASALRIWELNPKFRVWARADGPEGFAPEPEDYAIYDHGGGHAHIDCVETVTTVIPMSKLASRPKYKAFTTIGGNTNKLGGRQGIGVFGGIQRRTDDPQLVGFLRFVGRNAGKVIEVTAA